jgi:hypothetical protein
LTAKLYCNQGWLISHLFEGNFCYLADLKVESVTNLSHFFGCNRNMFECFLLGDTIWLMLFMLSRFWRRWTERREQDRSVTANKIARILENRDGSRCFVVYLWWINLFISMSFEIWPCDSGVLCLWRLFNNFANTPFVWNYFVFWV